MLTNVIYHAGGEERERENESTITPATGFEVGQLIYGLTSEMALIISFGS